MQEAEEEAQVEQLKLHEPCTQLFLGEEVIEAE